MISIINGGVFYSGTSAGARCGDYVLSDFVAIFADGYFNDVTSATCKSRVRSSIFSTGRGGGARFAVDSTEDAPCGAYLRRISL